MPKMVFPAPCPDCGEERKFIEFKAVPCTPGPDSPPARYGFRCMACKTILEEVTASDGAKHAWNDGQHVEA